MDEEYQLENIVNRIDIYDPVDGLFAQDEFLKEKESCKTQQEQVDFLYKYYSANSKTPRKLAYDYQFYDQDSSIDMRVAPK